LIQSFKVPYANQATNFIAGSGALTLYFLKKERPDQQKLANNFADNDAGT